MTKRKESIDRFRIIGQEGQWSVVLTRNDEVIDYIKTHLPIKKEAKKIVGDLNRKNGFIKKIEDIPQNLEKKIIEEFKAGECMTNIALKYNYNYQFIKRILIKNGIKLRPFSEERKRKEIYSKEKDIVEKYKKGIAIHSISKDHNCSSGPITRILKKNGIKIRKDGCRRRDIEQNSKKIIQDYKNGTSSVKLAREYRCTPYKIIDIIKKNRVKIKGAAGFFRNKTYEDRLGVEEAKIAKEKLSNYRGELKGNWKGGISFGEWGLNFTKILRNKVRERDNQSCLLCNIHRSKLKRALTVHHVDYIKSNSIEQNCISLCRGCHNIVHTPNLDRRGEWTAYFQNRLSKAYGYQYEKGKIVISLAKEEVI